MELTAGRVAVVTGGRQRYRLGTGRALRPRWARCGPGRRRAACVAGGRAADRWPVPGTERQPPRCLGPVPAGQHLGHRRREVVIADMAPRHPARDIERRHVPLQEGLLRAGGKHPVHALPRERQPVGEQVAGRHLVGQHDAHRPEIHLRLGARLLGLRHVPRHAARPRPVLRLDLGPPRPRVPAHIRIRHRHLVLIGQPLPDPPRGMPLLTRRVQVLPQHRVDQPRHRSQHRGLPHRRLPRRRHRRRQRLPHHPPVHPMPARQRPHP